jgi:ornithine carbamoyltransferase
MTDLRHLITLNDITTAEMERIFEIASSIKAKFREGVRESLLPSRVMALIFEKQSLRTRVSFESGMTHLGGSSMYLGADVGFGKRESMSDFGRVLGKLVDVVVIRAKRHDMVASLAEHSTCPVINGLTDLAHPCQALADLLTIREEFSDVKGRTVAWVGDANNVSTSLIRACGKAGMKITMAVPKAYQYDDATLTMLHDECPGLELSISEDPKEAVREASAVYTDVWVSMGQEKEEAERKATFGPFQVNAELMSAAPSDAIFLHCLPAKRGQEVTDDVIDSPNSRIIEQAANRMHAQKGAVAWLLGAEV